MKVFLISLLVAAAFAAPAPLDEETGEPVELIVNGVPEGEPLEIGDVLGIKVKEHVEGVIVSATDLLHPLTAAGMEEIEADRPQEPMPEPPILPPINVPEDIYIPESYPSEILPEPIEIPEPIVPELNPEPIEIPDPIVPELNPEPIEIPEAILPEIVPPVDPEVGPDNVPQPQPPIDNFPELDPPVDNLPELPPAQPEPEQFPNGEIFNNGAVQVSLNAEPGVLSTVQSWFSMVLNYFNGYYVSSQQIV